MTTPRTAIGVALILLASNAYFWHARDWNVSSRLMLAYALADRGTVRINGLEDHTRDRARIGDRYYSDKLPGLSFLAVPPYLAAKAALGLPAHPLDRKGQGFTHWPSDYWITLGTSGLLTSLCGGLLVLMAGALGCGPRRAALVGLAYGLATPAYVYATLAYGHQATAFFLLASFAAIERARRSPRPMAWAFAGGFAGASAAAVELQVAPAAAVVGLYGLGLIATRRLPPRSFAGLALGAAIPTLAVLAYNVAAFGSPFDMGYFHEDLAQFQAVHSAANPLGLRGLAWGRAGDLLWGEHRGLLAFAPILALAPFGLVAMGLCRRWAPLGVSAGVSAAVFLVNLSYPEWTGGWSTGPRLLVPLLPFAMLAVAGLLAIGGRGVVAAAAVLAIAGGIEMAMFQAVGGRIPPAPEGLAASTPYDRPFRAVVWPLWRGDPLREWGWKEGVRFDRNVVSEGWPAAVRSLPEEWRWLQFAPLLLGQIAAIGALIAWPRRGGASGGSPRGSGGVQDPR